METQAISSPLSPIRQKIEALEIKLKQAKALAQKHEAREKAKTQSANRQIDTRKKVLLGAYVLANMPAISNSQEFLDWLVRDDERALFGLVPSANRSS